MWINFLGLLYKNAILVKTSLATFGQHLGDFELLFSLTTGHTDSNLIRQAFSANFIVFKIQMNRSRR